LIVDSFVSWLRRKLASLFLEPLYLTLIKSASGLKQPMALLCRTPWPCSLGIGRDLRGGSYFGEGRWTCEPRSVNRLGLILRSLLRLVFSGWPGACSGVLYADSTVERSFCSYQAPEWDFPFKLADAKGRLGRRTDLTGSSIFKTSDSALGSSIPTRVRKVTIFRGPALKRLDPSVRRIFPSRLISSHFFPPISLMFWTRELGL
jgi:hypothetical protein